MVMIALTAPSTVASKHLPRTDGVQRACTGRQGKMDRKNETTLYASSGKKRSQTEYLTKRELSKMRI
jgi:hypothetical protein